MPKSLKIYYATNRRHKGRQRWAPTSYGTEFSKDGTENLRLGKVTLQADAAKVKNPNMPHIKLAIARPDVLGGGVFVMGELFMLRHVGFRIA